MTSSATDTEVHFLQKVRIQQLGFEEALIAVLRQTRKERWWDVIVKVWLKSPQNTFSLGGSNQPLSDHDQFGDVSMNLHDNMKT